MLRRKWLGESAYGELVALCQFLPGPASSQVGFALGLWRAGPLGALAAWAGFTLPSAILLVCFALGAGALDGPVAQGVLHGLKLVAVAVVAQAVWGMAKSLTPDLQRVGIALVCLVLAMTLAGSTGQVLAIVFGGLAGLVLCRAAVVPVAHAVGFGVSRSSGIVALAVFVLLLLTLPLLAGLGRALRGSLYDPVWTSAILGPLDVVLALAGFVALVMWKLPPWSVVLALGTAGGLLGAFA